MWVKEGCCFTQKPLEENISALLPDRFDRSGSQKSSTAPLHIFPICRIFLPEKLNTVDLNDLYKLKFWNKK